MSFEVKYSFYFLCSERACSWSSSHANNDHQCVVGCPGAVLSQRCRVVPANNTSNQHATPCTAQAQPARTGPALEMNEGVPATPPVTLHPHAAWQIGTPHSGCHRMQRCHCVPLEQPRTDLQVQRDGDVVQLRLLNGPKIIQLRFRPRHQH